ncbi:MAG: DUF2807 domain-containing protein [Bacteroidales bacterium]|nr:DUF2807 domain-containing protein [Bacteroidales bacterium]
MKNIVILVSLSIFFFGCTKDWGTPATKNYPINGAYTKLDVSNAFEVTVSDQVTDVVVTVGELAHDRVVVKVVDGELQIGFKPNTNYSGKAKAVIPAAVLRKLDLSGASSFTGDLRGDDVDIELSGASTYRGTVDATELDIDLSGASDAILSGACQTKMEIDLSGASTLKAADLSAMSVYGKMSGASDADVTVCSALNVELSGASTLTYGTSSEECHPNVNCPASGGSVVKPRN